MADFLESPFPVLIGMAVESEEDFEKIFDRVTDCCLFVMLDSNKLQIKLSNQLISVEEYHDSVETTESGEVIEYKKRVLPRKSK